MKKQQSLSKFTVPPGFRGRSAVIVQLWWLVQALLIRPSPQPLYGWRAFWWQAFGASLGSKVKIRPTARVTYPWKVAIGDNCWIGDRTELYSLEQITIGPDSCISQDAYLCTGSHDPEAEDFRYTCRPIVIGAGAWIGAGAFVGPGVSVGDGTVLAARGLTMRDLEPGLIYAGHPARKIKERCICR